MIKTIIAGSRGLTDTPSYIKDKVGGYVAGENYKMHSRWLLEFLAQPPFNSSYNDVEIVEGEADGSDLHGKEFANRHGIPVKPFPVTPKDWSEYGKRAGRLRNIDMANYVGNDGILIAFLSSRHECRGTKHMISVAVERNMSLFVVTLNPVIPK